MELHISIVIKLEQKLKRKNSSVCGARWLYVERTNSQIVIQFSNTRFGIYICVIKNWLKWLGYVWCVCIAYRCLTLVYRIEKKKNGWTRNQAHTYTSSIIHHINITGLLN